MALAETKLSLRERNKIRLRAELLDAVLELFLDDDPAALNVEAVARHVGCAKATVYVYFPGGMNEMLCAIYDEISQEVTTEAIREREAAKTTHGRIMALARVLLHMAARPRRGKFFAQLNPVLSPALQPVLGKSSGLYGQMIAEDLAREHNGETDALSVLIVGALREASVRIAQTPEGIVEFLAGVSTLVQGLIEAGQPHKDAEVEE